MDVREPMWIHSQNHCPILYNINTLYYTLYYIIIYYIMYCIIIIIVKMSRISRILCHEVEYLAG
ncbi:unnamed protein product, partial [Nesidiocoris tenuis]